VEEVPKKDYAYGWRDEVEYSVKLPPGLSEEIVKEISRAKGEPEWMLQLRLKAFKAFMELPLPRWGPDLSGINYEEIIYYAKPNAKTAVSWDEVPEEIKRTFEAIGVPEAERKVLAGAAAQYDSEVIYHHLKEELERLGVVFISMDEAVKKYPELVKAHFGKLVPYNDNKFAALNTALWSGGSFVYVPKNVRVPMPLQAYFRINLPAVGQFERTLIIVEEGAEVEYIEGCTAPIYKKASLHAAVVEVFAKAHSRVRYTTVQNWSKNVYNLVTKRSIAYEGAYIEWLDGNLGSKVTMKYPGIVLAGRGAKGKVISIAYAGEGQHIDSGAKAIHLAKDTSSTIVSKSISAEGGIASYRGWVRVSKGAEGSKVSVNCDALLLDEKSRTDTYPHIHIEEEKVKMAHEAKVGKISEEQLFYLQQRGISEEEARTMIVLGFLREFTKELPLEYAVELNRLIRLEMEGSVG